MERFTDAVCQAVKWLKSRTVRGCAKSLDCPLAHMLPAYWRGLLHAPVYRAGYRVAIRCGRNRTACGQHPERG